MANEKRLIDANAFCKSTAFICGGSALDPYWNGYADALDRVEEVLEQQPTVDAVEVVHAQWLYDSGSGCYFCSACDEYAIVQLYRDLDGTEYYEECLTNYCPNCGAHMMDGDGNA